MFAYDEYIGHNLTQPLFYLYSTLTANQSTELYILYFKEQSVHVQFSMA